MTIFKNMVIGGIVGMGIGTILIPSGWLSDACAPISYPIFSALGMASGVQGAGGDKNAIITATIGGAALGVASIPFAGVSAVLRPITNPVYGLLIGAGLGAVISKGVEE